ncbi:MAG: hypothetical protein MK102_10045 [Fuerstiella sp.]|nr:hypothetical protein [Fuerstiella sp.]
MTQSRSAPSVFIAGPVIDRIGIIYAPLLALAIGIIISASPLKSMEIEIGSYKNHISRSFIACFIFAHLFLVFFRSHANPVIFRQHQIQFVIVPIALFGGMLLSQWMLIAMAVLAIAWDVYHSCMQTFGIGRIYDAKAGNDPNVGRRLDLGLNILLYAGPILAGATLMLHVEQIDHHAGESLFFTAVPAFAMQHQRVLTWLILGVGLPYITWYVLSYFRLWRQGYHVSFEKVALLASTGYCSVYTWGFNSVGQAFFIMNFFHALQYFVIVWKTEGSNLQKRAGLGGKRWGRWPTLLGFLCIAVGFGIWAEITQNDNDVVFIIITLVAILHFWYDGFIWSVRRKEV